MVWWFQVRNAITGNLLTYSLASKKNQTLFQHLVCEIAQDFENNQKIQSPAIVALKEAYKGYLVGLLEDTSLCAICSKYVIVMSNDICIC
eukprot:CCRYP_003307-RA/>CCRYP_003307-RA protein AED:0.21 eAED:0.21 QI:0/0/0/0.5/1/1/2/0/89